MNSEEAPLCSNFLRENNVHDLELSKTKQFSINHESCNFATIFMDPFGGL
jgi:hypothetical protein